jgi:hypothetical protein
MIHYIYNIRFRKQKGVVHNLVDSVVHVADELLNYI